MQKSISDFYFGRGVQKKYLKNKKFPLRRGKSPQNRFSANQKKLALREIWNEIKKKKKKSSIGTQYEDELILEALQFGQIHYLSSSWSYPRYINIPYLFSS